MVLAMPRSRCARIGVRTWFRRSKSACARLEPSPASFKCNWFQVKSLPVLRRLGLSGVRHHGLLDDDMAVVTAPGTYDFTKVDESWDFLLKQGVTPIVELSFMPAYVANCTWMSADGARVVNPGKAACHTGMQYKHVDQHPAGDQWSLWYDVCKALVAHAVERYGLAAVQSWHFEVREGMTTPRALTEHAAKTHHVPKNRHRSTRTATAREGGPRPPLHAHSLREAARSWKALLAHLVAFCARRPRPSRLQVWNEMWGMAYPSAYLPLYNASASAIKAVHPSLKVGGPATMQLQARA